MIKRIELFASANTGDGFVNHFKYINTSDEYYNFILKGGSGTGKSTLMKRIGKFFENNGEAVEYFYCSSDHNSLDAVHLVGSDIAIIDGTAPHITEATIPKVNSEIVNLGEYIGDNIINKRTQIKKLIDKKSELYTLFYKHLKVIKDIDDIIDFKSDKNKDFNNYCLQVLNNLKLEEKQNMGVNRKLFCKCFAPDGINEISFKDFRIIKLELNATLLSNALKKLAQQINYLGYQTISLLNIINPDKVEGLIIRELDTILIGKKQKYSGFKQQLKIDIQNNTMRACNVMREIRKIHTNLEKHYIKHLDIKGLDYEYKRLLCKIIDMNK